MTSLPISVTELAELNTASVAVERRSVAVVRSPGEWAEVVRADLARSVEGFVSAGRHLAEAKAQLSHGEWLPWIERELPVGVRTVQMLISLAENDGIANAQRVAHLPPSIGSLYELSRLDAPVLEQAIADGRVTPELERKQARALVAEYRITATSEPVVVDSEPGPAEVPEGLVSTVLADPPWRYGNTSTRGAAEDHYPTMSIEELCDLDIARTRAADEAHLYLWTTAGHLPQAFTVMEAWGFTYKTYLVWVKPQMGMGNYFRVSTELVLFGVKGGMRTLHRGLMNWFEEPRSKHSAKPESFHDLVMKASPGPYLEMFARCRRDTQLSCGCSRCRLGWEVWGNET